MTIPDFQSVMRLVLVAVADGVPLALISPVHPLLYRDKEYP